MERLGVRMRTMASSTAVRTAEVTRVKEPNFLPTKVVATDSHSLHDKPLQVPQCRHVKLHKLNMYNSAVVF